MVRRVKLRQPRPRALTDCEVERARQLRKEGYGWGEIARRLGNRAHRRTVKRAVRGQGAYRRRSAP